MTEQKTSAEQPATKHNFGWLLDLTLLGVLAVMFLVLTISTETFATPGNLSNLARQAAMFAVLAIGETFVIITTGIDLSVGLVASFVTVIVALLLQADYPIWVAILGGLLVGVAIGAFHGFGVVQMGLPPFIITLATFSALQGIGLLITNGSTINVTNDAFSSFSRGDFLGIPNLFLVVIVVAIPAMIYLHQSKWGRYLYAVGSNAEAARLSGVNVKAVIYTAYILSAFFAAVAGIMLTARTGTGNAVQASGWELKAIASSVIGGTSLFGAVGTVWGPLIGAVILATIRNGANLLNVNSFWEYIITGALIIVIVYFDGLRRARR
jgi:ribose transport system permease protein